MARRELETAIRTCIDDFVEELTTLVKQAAVESVQDALGATPSTRRGPGRPKGSRNAAPRAKSGGRVRRSAGDVGAVGSSILQYVRANPGSGVTEIASALGLSSKDLRLPVKKLLEEKKVSTTGQRRGTKYHAGRSAGRSAKKSTRKKKAKRKTTRKKRR